MPHAESKLKICVLSFNHPQITAKCVADVLKVAEGWPVALTHNGSRPENILQLQKQFPQIEHHIVGTNAGYSAGANALLRHAFENTDWVFFVTNDCELLNRPEPPPAPGLYAPTLYRRKIDKIDSLGGLFTPHKGKLEHIREQRRAEKFLPNFRNTNQAKSDFRGHPLLLSLRKFKNKILPQYFYVPGTAFYLDRETFNALGGFDESLHTYWEDVDLSARAHKLNLNLGLKPETKLIHKVGKTCHKDPFYTNTLFQRNRKIVSNRYSHSVLRWLKK